MCVHVDTPVDVSPHHVNMYKTVFVCKYAVWVWEGAEGEFKSMCVYV